MNVFFAFASTIAVTLAAMAGLFWALTHSQSHRRVALVSAIDVYVTLSVVMNILWRTAPTWPRMVVIVSTAWPGTYWLLGYRRRHA